ncbi:MULTISPECIES: rod shape-determining protein MreC [Flavobacteriaceae]|uniref:Cell shape-determining protein MreC n=2 Tax=Flavobacteriaceae TaxID=49546 RepID=A0A4Y8ATF7_9FLAO|nr:MULTISPECIES: rod shape-determining protein MreC [Flavobacteriaceae]TEW75164.1 rod shape-determining protein MreC [Gramella jeungdoensis]GGK41114.1 rod shape-determining protein MreC [Lutibacter litoralis]
MQQLIYFIRKFKYFLLFILLESIAFIFIIQHHSFHKSKFINSSNYITGGIYNTVSSINDFFYLKSENHRLIEENIRLRNLLNKSELNLNKDTFILNDSSKYGQKYKYSFAKIINNNFTKRNNTLTLNKGTNQGITADLGVINSNGIIGVTKSTSKNYSTVLSILNKNSKINVRLKNSNHYGTLIWNGKDYNILQLIDIPRQAKIKVGDTIITGGKSAIFPEGIKIGTIKNFKFESNQYKNIDIELFNDMSSIGYVQIVKNLERIEQQNLETSILNE